MLAAMSATTLSAQEAKQIADNLNVPTELVAGTKLTIPTVDGATVELLGADYEQIIQADGSIRYVVSDTPVNVNFKVTKDGKEAFSKDYEILVKVAKTPSVGNPKPQVIPSILQWNGGTGDFKPGDKVKVRFGSMPKEQAEIILRDLQAVLGEHTQVTEVTTGNADIIFLKTSEGNCDEEYTMMVEPSCVRIAARSPKGQFWGSRTLLQILKQNKGSVPCGIAYDVPRYEVRGVLFDIARTPYTLKDLRDVINAMAWYKMNDLHLVINNNYIFLEEYVQDGRDPLKEAYTAFRLESKMVGTNGQKLTADDVWFTKKEFRELIDYAKLRGVNIVPEFDTPGHALSFTKVRPDLIYQGPMNHPGRRSDHIDAGNPETLKFVGEVLDEYLMPDAAMGNKPVLDGCVVHVGADEFYGEAEVYRKFADGLLKHVKSRGFTPRIWGSLTHKPGKTTTIKFSRK